MPKLPQRPAAKRVDKVGGEPLTYSVAAACKYVPTSRSNLYRLLKSGTLRAKKLGGRTVILGDDLRRLVESLPDWQPAT